MTIHFSSNQPHALMNAQAVSVAVSAPVAQSAPGSPLPPQSDPARPPEDAIDFGLPPGANRPLPWGTQAVAEGIFAGQATAAPALKTRDDVAAYLKAQGFPAAEDTLTYLDNQAANYSEIGELIASQQSFGRDANDVLGAIQSYGVVLEATRLNVPGTELTQFKEVAAGLRDGRVRVDRDTERTDMSNSAGRYRFEDDTIFLPPGFDLNSTYRRSVLFHELVHTRQDITHGEQRYADKPLFQDAEVEAYKAQGHFLASNRVRPDDPEIAGHKVLSPAIRHGQWAIYERQQTTQTPPDAAKIAKARQQQTAIAEHMYDEVSRYYSTSRQTLTANGLHTHHH